MTTNNAPTKSDSLVTGDIDRRQFLKAAGATLAVTGAALSGGEAFALRDTDKPNILIVITDQQHMDTIAAAGCKYVRTPAMDDIKRHGVSFMKSYSSNPVCGPARSSIFTGRTCSETGVFVNGLAIRKGIPNLGEWFSKQSDYETLYAGKWHVPHTHQSEIEGFDVIHTGIGGQGNVGDTSTSRACEGFLRNRKDARPFLMVASFMQPHDICEWLRINTENPDKLRYDEIANELPPLPDNFEFDDKTEPDAVRKSRIKREPTKGGWSKAHWRYYLWSYYRHIEMVDGEIGRVVQALDETGVRENTIIIFTADHGEGLGHHKNVRKSVLYDEAARVPMIVSCSGRTRQNVVDTDHLVSGLDLVQTCCDYAGIRSPENVRGLSMRGPAEGKKTAWRDFLVSEVSNDSGRMVRSNRYKFITYDGDETVQLFDMEKDPGETENLALNALHKPLVDQHRVMLIEWEKALDVASGQPHAKAWWRKG